MRRSPGVTAGLTGALYSGSTKITGTEERQDDSAIRQLRKMPSDWGYKHKPFEPVSYDDIDFSDRRQVQQARDSLVREQWIKTMEQRLVRDELAKCYRAEGVNHYVACKDLAERKSCQPLLERPR